MRLFAILSLILVMVSTPLAQTSNNAELESQAREIGRALRCVVCQNQSIEDSDADLARDMRELVRTRLAEGDEPEEVIEFVRARYGDYVLLKPPVQRNTWALWAGPGLILMVAVFLLMRRKRAVATVDTLSDDEIETLRELRRQTRRDDT